MAYDPDDTVAAIASAPGGAQRGIIRVSGPDAVGIVSGRFASADGSDLHALRQPSAVDGILRLLDPLGDVPAAAYVWPNSRSYTGQPSVEIHTIGSPPVLEAALKHVCAGGARLAEPGEFTMRAFLSGRLDLTQAEAVLGVIDAASQTELDVALAQLAGGLTTPLGQLRSRLLDLLADLEAGLDFVEEDIQFIATDELVRQLTDAITRIEDIARQMIRRGDTRTELRVALIGAPNVGKSSLFNALAGDSAAIVTERAGTTRDYIARQISFGTTECLLTDTAGVEPHAPTDAVGQAAQAQTARQSQQAHLQILCIDASRGLNDWEQATLASKTGTTRLIVLTKCDLPRVAQLSETALTTTSSAIGFGIAELRNALARAAADLSEQAGGVVANTAVRCTESLRLAAECLQRAREVAVGQLGEELAAAEIRGGLNELGKVVGAIYTDDVLDRVFSRFCIGK